MTLLLNKHSVINCIHERFCSFMVRYTCSSVCVSVCVYATHVCIRAACVSMCVCERACVCLWSIAVYIANSRRDLLNKLWHSGCSDAYKSRMKAYAKLINFNQNNMLYGFYNGIGL